MISISNNSIHAYIHTYTWIHLTLWIVCREEATPGREERAMAAKIYSKVTYIDTYIHTYIHTTHTYKYEYKCASGIHTYMLAYFQTYSNRFVILKIIYLRNDRKESSCQTRSVNLTLIFSLTISYKHTTTTPHNLLGWRAFEAEQRDDWRVGHRPVHHRGGQ